MREESALLGAIASGDDTARLAYADWLEERGDPRAAWVRDLTVWRWMAPDAHDPVPSLLAALEGDDWQRHQNAQKALPVVGPPAVPGLLEMLKLPGDRYGPAWHAGEVLAKMPREAVEPALPLLFELAANEDDTIRGGAIAALQAVGEAALPALPALCAALECGEYRHNVAEAAAIVVRNLGPAASSAIRDLLELGAYEYEIRDTVESALATVAARSVPDLLRAIADIDEDDRRLWAANVLRLMGPAIIPQLREAVARTDSADWESVMVGEVASVVLAAHDPEAALPVLIAGLADCAGDDREADLEFAKALLAMGPSAAPVGARMRELLPRLSGSARETVVETLEKLGQGELTREEVLLRFEHPEEGERVGALSVLGRLDEIPDRLIPAVVAHLDSEGRPHYDARNVLEQLAKGPRRERIWPTLTALVAHPKQDVARWAIEQLAEHPGESEAAFRACFSDSRPVVRALALDACAGLSGLSAEFLRLAADRNSEVRIAAARRLGDTGPFTSSIASKVRNLLRSRVGEVRRQAIRAVAIRGPVRCGCAALVARLAHEDSDADIREHAIDLVPECLPLARAVALLRRCLAEDNEERPRRAAAYALGLLTQRPGGREAVLLALPELIAQLVEDEAVRAISELGEPAVPALIAALRKTGSPGACEALGLLGTDASSALPALIDALSTPSAHTREKAALALARIGLPAPQAIPALRRMLWADTESEAEVAIFALASIGATVAFDDLARMAQGEQLPVVALWAIARLGDARSQLRQALHSPQADVRAFATIELARLGAGPPASVADLFAVCEVSPLRAYALDELERRDDPDILSQATEASRSGGHSLHSFGMEVLARIGHRDPAAVTTALTNAFACHDEIVLRGLGEFGRGSPAAYHLVRKRMFDYKPSTRAAGVAAMRQFLADAAPSPD